jgi:hypothetical protein
MLRFCAYGFRPYAKAPHNTAASGSSRRRRGRVGPRARASTSRLARGAAAARARAAMHRSIRQAAIRAAARRAGSRGGRRPRAAGRGVLGLVMMAAALMQYLQREKICPVPHSTRDLVSRPFAPSCYYLLPAALLCAVHHHQRRCCCQLACCCGLLRCATAAALRVVAAPASTHSRAATLATHS